MLEHQKFKAFKAERTRWQKTGLARAPLELFFEKLAFFKNL